jgi:hypothetical protein
MEEEMTLTSSAAADAAEPPLVDGLVLPVGGGAGLVRGQRPQDWPGEVYVQDDMAWPPPPDDDDQWLLVPDESGTPRRCRAVLLWDEPVLVDLERQVFCLLCHRFLSPVQMGMDQYGRLGGTDSSRHLLGLPRASLVQRARG